jgi:hypothetical protein
VYNGAYLFNNGEQGAFGFGIQSDLDTNDTCSVITYAKQTAALPMTVMGFRSDFVNNAKLRGSGVNNLNMRSGLLRLEFDSATKLLNAYVGTNNQFVVTNTQHTVTATVTSNSVALAGVTINFEITSGPNTGQIGLDITDVNGRAEFTYIGGATLGTDAIEATGKIVNKVNVAANEPDPNTTNNFAKAKATVVP